MPNKPEKRPLPGFLQSLGKRAIDRHMRRPAAPDIDVEGDAYGDGWVFSSPYREDDEEAWLALLFEAFGTRSTAAFNVFTTQLSLLCSQRYDHEAGHWRPDEHELIAAVQLVKTVQPRNEVEAALAAQMVAVHFTTMKLAAAIAQMPSPDARTVGTMGKLARTYTSQMEAMDRLKGKRRSTRQSINVKHEKHVHTHQHVHLERGGAKNGGQACEPCGSPNSENKQIEQAGPDAGGASVPSSHSSRVVVPMPRKQGEGSLSPARGRKRIRGADR